MGQPAARLGDDHTCPQWSGDTPHVGGPILPSCEPTVLIGGLPAARVGDPAYCNGPTDIIVQGSPTVFIGGRMAARLGDRTAHGGVIVAGHASVLIGDGGGGANVMKQLTDPGAELSIPPHVMPPGDENTPGAKALSAVSSNKERRQQYSNCGLQAVNQTLYLAKGGVVDETELLNWATKNGLADSGKSPRDSGGTTVDQRMKLLSQYGVAATHQPTTVDGIANAVKNGQATIVEVNGGTLFGAKAR